MIKTLFAAYPAKAKRLFEILIPLTSWAIITMPFWLSFWHPAIVAYFVVLFVVYWFYKSATLAYNAFRSYLTMTSHLQVNWLALAKKEKGFDDIHHLIIIPEYNEPIHVLRKTIENLLLQDFPLKQLTVCLGTEDRDSIADKTAHQLMDEFGGKFGHFLVTKHTLMHGEVSGKSSNMAFASKEATRKLVSFGYAIDDITVTSCDADALLHPKYFSYLTYLFLTDSERYYHFYQASVMFYSNIWQVPIPGRVLSTMGSIFSLSLLKQGIRLINFSTYSLSLKTAREVGYWSVDVIPEDYHMFFKTYFAKGSKVRVIPIFLPVLVQAALSTSFWKTIVNQYEQQKRWAWGVSDVPDVIKGYCTHPEIPLWDRTIRLFNLLESHIVWPTNWFILTLGSTIPPIINEQFARTSLGHNLSRISSIILTLCIVFLLVLIYLDRRAKPPAPTGYAKWKIPFLYLQWFTLPVISFFLSALPGLDAHTRLMFGKRLEYRVTEKV